MQSKKKYIVRREFGEYEKERERETERETVMRD